MPKYNVYRHKNRPELSCIVPTDQPLPAALEADMWEEEAAVVDERSAPPDFQESAARYALAIQGFYILRQRKHSQTPVLGAVNSLEM
jgi:hypothetical protein